MGKKRSLQSSSTNRIKVEVKDEIMDNEVSVARDRLKGALRELLRQSDEGSSADSGEDSSHDSKQQPKKTSKPIVPPPRKIRRRKQLPADQLFHHTYVMKLFDRSVDLAQFREDTPLYPICRAWLANQPRNPNLVPKIRTPSPEIVNEVHTDNMLEDSSGELRDVYCLPTPLPREEVFPRNRIPSPIPQPKDKLDLNYEGQVLKSRDALMKSHRAHWSAVRRKWHLQAQKNEKRFYQSANILSTIFKRAQTEFE
ncbi:protein lin-37 homolog [Chelonus insularis]|uniref:protein lin-37 homolog n=1 Tax=Chelonus insularis TaxID=460826 RepID=UPI00158AE5AF|nr:protein lin-37 homolog [Chelonus insularis]XP_034951711.1 protein lin-37 homolog [Chelonus insularis]